MAWSEVGKLGSGVENFIRRFDLLRARGRMASADPKEEALERGAGHVRVLACMRERKTAFVDEAGPDNVGLAKITECNGRADSGLEEGATALCRVGEGSLTRVMARGYPHAPDAGRESAAV